jgi:NitT/TauT family transport system permease protein
MSWWPTALGARRMRFDWADVVVVLAVVALLFAALHIRPAFSRPLPTPRSFPLDPGLLPYYAFRSALRLFAAFALSLLFTVVYGYAAARSRLLQPILVSLLDILQSVPVLGFLAVSVTFFVHVMPSPVLALELSAVFAIFTAQAWNMTFSFYHSLKTLPRDLDEAMRLYRLTRWQRLWHLELPAATIGLVLNSMMSFGGSWFFLAASEAVTYRGRTILLPGLGSYMAEAEARGDTRGMILAILTMIVVIVLIDQLFWRPIVAWSQKFKLEQVQTTDPPRSFILTLLRRSRVVHALNVWVLMPFIEWVDGLANRLSRPADRESSAPWLRWAAIAAATLILADLLLKVLPSAVASLEQLGWRVVVHVVALGLLTFARVMASVALGALWAVPVGVWIGLSHRLTRYAQPIAQIAASFPANMLFPFVVALFLRLHLGMGVGAVPLMMLGTQWYILFNVMAGAMAIPSDLKEAATVFSLRGLERWRSLILPAIFPYLVTGGITAAGGAWNASIVAEVVTWHGRTLAAPGLGALITEASEAGRGNLLLLGIVIMSLYVVVVNRLLWRPLYRLAEQKYHIE